MKNMLLLIVLFVAVTMAGAGNRWSAAQALSGAARASSQEATGVDFDSGRWQIKNPKAKVEQHLGRKSLHLPNGFAFLKDVVLENGVIEVDIAAPNLRSFVGIVFRFENEDDHEIVYFRPHKSGLEDAVQYTPSFNGSACWQLYSGKGFTTAVEFPREQWVHARIEISGLGGKIYLNNSEQPTLVIEDLKRGHSRGTVGLWSGANGGHFSNFTYKVEPVGERVDRKPPPVAAGIMARWELSEAFDVAQRDPETLPNAAEMKAMKWQRVGVEPPGMVVIDRYRRSPSIVRFFDEPSQRIGKREGRKVVFARATIYSESDQVRKMSLGYSDEVTVFLNSRPVFIGRSAFRFRDPGFLGIMDVENDAVYLDLKKGRNEIVLALADYFGGWGFISRIDDTRGVKLD